MQRRDFLRLGSALALQALVPVTPFTRALAAVAAGDGPYGPLLPPDENGIRLPEGFRSRVVVATGSLVPGTDYFWHGLPDGGAVFPTDDDGWIYVSNSESIPGGASSIRFDREANVVDAYRILGDTLLNCAGGATPWGTWLSCEEFPRGAVYECDPWGRRPAEQRPALGIFQHEAAAVDPETGLLYLTEDVGDGRFYRFLPNAWGNLTSGVLQVAEVTPDGDVLWHDVPDPTFSGATPTRHQVPASTPFDGGEGIVWTHGAVYFTTKGDGRVWVHHPGKDRLEVLYDDDLDPALPLHGVDNVTATARGDLVVAEDGDDMQLVMITRHLEVAPILQVVGQNHSELAGPAFDPSGRRLYVSSQRGGPLGAGITYEIHGPFHRTPRRRRRRRGRVRRR